MGVVAGAGACRGGWVAVVAEDGRFADSLFATSFAKLLDGLGEAAAIGVDIPIGLPIAGVRAADVAARAFVGPRRSSVFPTPPRAALVAATYADGRRVLPSLSAQSFALGKKILEVETHLEERVFEVHPEVSFAALAGRHLRYSKRSWNGQMERRRLLAEQGFEFSDELAAGQAAADDVLDAAVAAPGQPSARHTVRRRHFRLIRRRRTAARSQSGTSRELRRLPVRRELRRSCSRGLARRRRSASTSPSGCQARACVLPMSRRVRSSGRHLRYSLPTRLGSVLRSPFLLRAEEPR